MYFQQHNGKLQSEIPNRSVKKWFGRAVTKRISISLIIIHS